MNFDSYKRLGDLSQISGILNDDMVCTYANSYYCVLSLDGFNSHTASDEKLANLSTFINNIITSSKGDFIFHLHTKRDLLTNIDIGKQTKGLVGKEYAQVINHHLKNNYFLIVRVLFRDEKKISNWNLYKKLINGNRIENNKNIERGLQEKLKVFVSNIELTLNDYLSVSTLRGLDLKDFLGRYFFNNKNYLDENSYRSFKQRLSFYRAIVSSHNEINFNVNFGLGRTCISYADANVYSKILYVRFDEFINNKFLSVLYSADKPIRVDTIIKPMTKDKSMLYVDNAIKDKETLVNTQTDLDDMESMHSMIDEIREDKFLLVDLSMTIEVFGDSLDELKVNCGYVHSLAQSYGVIINEIDNNLIPFLGRLPEKDFLNGFKQKVTSQNILSLFNFHKENTGLPQTNWGDFLLSFKTIGNSLYRFNFHLDDKKNSLAHTFVIGHSSSGKTTFISLMLARYLEIVSDAKVVCFDKLNGLKKFTATCDGAYVDFENISSISFSPFLEFDLVEDSLFYIAFISALVNRELLAKEEKAVMVILGVLNSLVEESKNLSGFIELANTNTDLSKLVEELSVWSKEGHDIFNGNKVINYDDALTTFDMGSIVENKKMLAPISMYLLYKIKKEQRYREGKPLIVFIDEFRGYMISDIFTKFFNEMSAEMRKYNCVLICATQSPKHLHDARIISSLNNFANYFIFPDSQSSVDDYSPSLQGKNVSDDNSVLSKKDAKIITELAENDRRLLVIKNKLDTTVLDIDLSRAPKLLEMFNSDL